MQCPKLHYLTTYETSHAQWGIILLWCFDLINYYWKFAYASGALFIYIGKIGQCAVTLKQLNSRVLLLRQLWIVNHSVKSSSNNLSNENIHCTDEKKRKGTPFILTFLKSVSHFLKKLISTKKKAFLYHQKRFSQEKKWSDKKKRNAFLRIAIRYLRSY